MFLYKTTILSKTIVPDGRSYMSSSSQLLFSDYCQQSLFFSVSSDFYEKYIVTNNFCVSTHNSYCCLENSKFFIFLIGSSFDQILQRLGKFHFTYQIIDYLYTLYK